jgi:hypothetical protein
MFAVPTAATLQTACHWILNEARLSAPEKTLCFTIAADLAETPPVYPTVDLLARQLQYCEKSVRKHLKRLEGLGFIARINRFLPDLQKEATTVSLILPVAPASPSDPAPTPAPDLAGTSLRARLSAERHHLPSPATGLLSSSTPADGPTSASDRVGCRQPARLASPSLAPDPAPTGYRRQSARVASPAGTTHPALRKPAEIPPAPSRLPGKVLMLYDTTCIDLPPAGPITTAIEQAVNDMVEAFPRARYLSWWETYFRKMTDPELIRYLRGRGHTLNLTWLLLPENARMILHTP